MINVPEIGREGKKRNRGRRNGEQRGARGKKRQRQKKMWKEETDSDWRRLGRGIGVRDRDRRRLGRGVGFSCSWNRSRSFRLKPKKAESEFLSLLCCVKLLNENRLPKIYVNHFQDRLAVLQSSPEASYVCWSRFK